MTNVNCNHCGATLEVSEETRFVTCAYCHSSLEVERSASSIYTTVLDKIERDTGQIVENLKVIELQNEISRLDREWEQSRQDLQITGQNGARSNPSTAGSIVSLVIVLIFGGAWTVATMTMGAPAIFPLFGLFFRAFGVFAAGRSLVNSQKLSDARSAYESKRQQLLTRIQTERDKSPVMPSR